MWTTVVLYKCKCSSCVRFHAGDEDMLLCCANCKINCLGDFANVAHISCSCSSPNMCVFCMFSSCLDWNILHRGCLHICKLLPFLEEANQETIIWIYDKALCRNYVNIYAYVCVCVCVCICHRKHTVFRSNPHCNS